MQCLMRSRQSESKWLKELNLRRSYDITNPTGMFMYMDDAVTWLMNARRQLPVYTRSAGNPYSYWLLTFTLEFKYQDVYL